MPYIDLPGLTARFGEEEMLQLTDRDGDGVADVGLLAVVIADATAMIDSYLQHRVALPLDPAPAVLSSHCAALVRASLYKDGAPDPVTESAARAMAWLRDIAAGRASLGPAPAQVSAPAGRVRARTADKPIDWSAYP